MTTDAPHHREPVVDHGDLIVASTAQAADSPDISGHADDHTATSPWQFRWGAWREVLERTWRESTEDNIGLAAAGVAFYGFLAIVPVLAGVVLLYGLIADADAVLRDIRALVTVLPPFAAKLIAHQLVEVVTASTGKKGTGLIAALALAIFGARNGASAIITALNIAYERRESRSFVHLTLLALAMTAGGVLVAFVAVLAIAALGHLEGLLPTLPDAILVVGKILAYAALALAGAAGAATLYRYGPDRAGAPWVWLTPGSLATAAGWLILSLGFGVYVANVNDYSATYGSLSAIVVLLSWLYLSSYLLLLGAELNCELERQTGRGGLGGPVPPGGPPESREAAASPYHEGTAELETAVLDTVKPASLPAEAGMIRGVAATSRLVGLGNVGAVQSFMAAGGVALLRKRGNALKGIALLAAAAGLAFMGRAPGERVDKD